MVAPGRRTSCTRSSSSAGASGGLTTSSVSSRVGRPEPVKADRQVRRRAWRRRPADQRRRQLGQPGQPALVAQVRRHVPGLVACGPTTSSPFGVRALRRSACAKPAVRSSQPVGASSARSAATWSAFMNLWCRSGQPGAGEPARCRFWQDRAHDGNARLVEPAAGPRRLVIGILGGTGEQGRGLARRLSMAGHRVIIGSRDAGRARRGGQPNSAAARCSPAALNQQAAERADVVIAAMPWEGHRGAARRASRAAGRQGRDRLRQSDRVRLARRVPDRRCPRAARPSRRPPCCRTAPWWARSIMCRPSLLLDPEVDDDRAGRAGARRRPARRPTWCMRWPTGSLECAGSTAAGCATAARSRR